MKKIKANKGFTLIELLVVVAIIGILATVILSSLSKARSKARDAKRLADMKAIYDALAMYESDHGYVPITYTYSGANSGGWDNSVAGDFLPFLVTGGYMSKVPVDPINRDTHNDSIYGSNDYFYAYYCYPHSGITKGLALRYRDEEGTVHFYSAERAIGEVDHNIADDYFKCRP